MNKYFNANKTLLLLRVSIILLLCAFTVNVHAQTALDSRIEYFGDLSSAYTQCLLEMDDKKPRGCIPKLEAALSAYEIRSNGSQYKKLVRENVKFNEYVNDEILSFQVLDIHAKHRKRQDIFDISGRVRNAIRKSLKGVGVECSNLSKKMQDDSLIQSSLLAYVEDGQRGGHIPHINYYIGLKDIRGHVRSKAKAAIPSSHCNNRYKLGYTTAKLLGQSIEVDQKTTYERWSCIDLFVDEVKNKIFQESKLVRISIVPTITNDLPMLNIRSRIIESGSVNWGSWLDGATLGLTDIESTIQKKFESEILPNLKGVSKGLEDIFSNKVSEELNAIGKVPFKPIAPILENNGDRFTITYPYVFNQELTYKAACQVLNVVKKRLK